MIMQTVKNFECTDILGDFAEGITRRDPKDNTEFTIHHPAPLP